MFDRAFFLEQLKNLLAIDSPTGLYKPVQDYVEKQCAAEGVPCMKLHQGGLVAELGGEGEPLVVAAHLDTIGLMVRHIHADGTIKVNRIGGLYAFNCTGENVRIYTRGGRVISGSVCRTPNSIHVTESELRASVPDFNTNTCVVLDEPVKSAEDVRALGIASGDLIALDARLTQAGEYLKARFLDDKAGAALLLCQMHDLRGKKLTRKTYSFFSAYEEIGHGTAWIPADTKDIIALDIAPTGPEQTSDERKLTIACCDARFPYHWDLTNELCEKAKEASADFVTDVFTPHYGSDANTPVLSGYDVRHALIGPGTANSHGAERMHLDGIRNTYRLLKAVLTEE